MGVIIKERNGVFYNSFCVYDEDSYELDICDFANTNYGNFTKEELFWSIYEMILIPSHLYSYDCLEFEDKVHLFEISDNRDGEDEVWIKIEVVGTDEGYSIMRWLRTKTIKEAVIEFYT